MKNLVFDTWKSLGNTFDTVSKEAKSKATETRNVEFEFNGVKCIVSPYTDLDLLFRDYSNSWTMEWKEVGPNCVKTYSAEVVKELADKAAIREKKEEIRQAEYRKKEAKEKADFETVVAGISVKWKNVEGWEKFKELNSKDSYSKCVVDYAEGWAKLMQSEIEKGKTIIDCAEKTSHKLGFLGITGFMYGAAVHSLSEFWEYGEDLRKWHNKEYKYEGDGVVNPAVLTISN